MKGLLRAWMIACRRGRGAGFRWLVAGLSLCLLACGPSDEELAKALQAQEEKLSASCLTRPGCASDGQCSGKIFTREGFGGDEVMVRDCVVATRDDCMKAEICARSGRCTPVKNDEGETTCEIRSREDCLITEACKDRGECSAVEENPKLSHVERAAIRMGDAKAPARTWDCAVKNSEDCAGSRGCKTSGECTATPQESDGLTWLTCNVGSDADCQKASECRVSGKCTKAPYSPNCIATTAESCQKSENCKSLGECSLYNKYCTSVESRDKSIATKRRDEACERCIPRCEARADRASERRFERALDRGEVGFLDAVVGGVVDGAASAIECELECKPVCEAPLSDYMPRPEPPPGAEEPASLGAPPTKPTPKSP